MTEEKLRQLGIQKCADLQCFERAELQEMFGKFGWELYDLCRGIDRRPVEPNRLRKSLSNEETFATNLATLAECEEKMAELFEELAAELAQKAPTRSIRSVFVKLKFDDFKRTTVERAGFNPTLSNYRQLLTEAFGRADKSVRLMGVGVRFNESRQGAQEQLSLL